MNGLNELTLTLRDIRERVAVVASDLEAIADALHMYDINPRQAAALLRDKVRELGGAG